MDVSQGKKNVSQKKERVDNMSKEELMSEAINSFILDNNFLMDFILDNVRERIYKYGAYSEQTIVDVIAGDIDAGYTDSYIVEFIIESIDIYPIVSYIDSHHGDSFRRLASQC